MRRHTGLGAGRGLTAQPARRTMLRARADRPGCRSCKEVQDIKRLTAESNRLAARSSQMLRVLLRTVRDPIERSQLHSEAIALRGARPLGVPSACAHCAPHSCGCGRCVAKPPCSALPQRCRLTSTAERTSCAPKSRRSRPPRWVCRGPPLPKCCPLPAAPSHGGGLARRMCAHQRL